jgi:hypothetical protein
MLSAVILPSGAGYILCRVICGNTIENPKWVASMEKAIGTQSWSKLIYIFSTIKVIGQRLKQR